MKKYQAVFQNLESKIMEGVYLPNQPLPSEQELTKSYQVSRDTIRKALGLLAKQGLITKSQGRQSYVKKRQAINFPVSDLTSYQELTTALNMNSQTKVISLDRIIVDQKLADLTGFPPSKQVWHISRQRLVDGRASVLDRDYLLTDLVKRMTPDIPQYSLYNYLENELKLDIAWAEKEITIDQKTEQDQLFLDMGNEHHVVSVKSKVYLANQQQFQFTESRHLLDKFHFVDLAKRKK
ncbi:trehalose operon repressor [Streptococcus dentapri]|uniref:Trehalose operon repressor n=1 Tax=Streptococcus dentapri TaxID=573564 RepID=A0ABV8D2H8_9STRE